MLGEAILQTVRDKQLYVHFFRMHFSVITALALMSAAVLAEPISHDGVVNKRTDNWCRVVTNTSCRKGPGKNYDTVRVEGRDYITPEKHFGVKCTKEGTDVNGDRTWNATLLPPGL